MAQLKRKWGYKYFECSHRMEQVIAEFAEKNRRTFSKEVKKTLCRAYGIPEDEQEEVLPPLIAQIDKPAQGRPGRKKSAA